MTFLLVLLVPETAWATPEDTSNLDGLHLTIGPVLAATWIDRSATTGAGAGIALLRITEHRLPEALGLSIGGLGYTDRDGSRLWLEAEMAVQGPLPFAVGLGVGATAEVDPVRPPRVGAQATMWIFAGALPYIRVGTVAEAGQYLELGLLIRIPTLRSRR